MKIFIPVALVLSMAGNAAGQLLQFPVPIQRSLNALYGIGLLVPQFLVMTGAWVYLRRRSA